MNLISPLHKPIRRLTRDYLRAQIPQQLGLVAWAQQFTHPMLDQAVFFSAATVTIEFYLLLLPVLAWCGYDHLVAMLVGLMALQAVAVFGLKELLESPRPADCLKAAPSSLGPITIRDYSGDIEDGLPSAHCSGSVALLIYCVEAAAAAGLVGSEARLGLQLAAAGWVGWIAFGRLYLSVHSPVDLAGGCLLGYAVLQLWQLLEQPYNSWLASSALLPLHVAAVSFIVMRCSPMASRPTAAYSYCTAWLGGWAGVTLGYRFIHPAAAAAAAAAVPGVKLAARAVGLQQQLAALPLWMAAGMMAAKMVVGLAVVAATKVAVKEGMLLLLPRVFGLVPTCLRCLWQPPVAGVAKCSSGDSRVGGSGKSSSRGVTSSNVHSSDEQSESRLTSSSSGCRLLVLRHAVDGTPNDVAVTARFAAYVAVGFVVATFDAAWQPLVANYMFASNTA